MNASIPQDSVIGCLLFLIYINNLPKIINRPCVLFLIVTVSQCRKSRHRQLLNRVFFCLWREQTWIFIICCCGGNRNTHFMKILTILLLRISSNRVSFVTFRVQNPKKHPLQYLVISRFGTVHYYKNIRKLLCSVC